MILPRHFSIATKITRPTTYVSRSTCPYFNLALEDWIFRNTPADIPLLLLYRNSPSVIIGRNQNPWKEINQAALSRLGIAFVRRRSGGGTVYHDLGNTNYSIMVPRASFERRPNAELVARAVASLGPPAWVNERNDIVVEGFKMSFWHLFTCPPGDYVSGSAYKIVNKRAYHHGTMLIDARLNQLGDLLHNTKENLITKGVESVRSPVQNLRRWAPNLTHEAFVDAVAQEFQKTYNGSQDIHEIDKDLVDDIPGIRSVYEELQTWNWQYGQTPEFTHRLSGTFDWGDISADVSSKHGRITAISLSHIPPLVSDDPYDDVEDICLKLSTDLVGSKYATLADSAAPPTNMQERDERIRNQILAWLKEEM
ncbi:hypothetical protein M407DRAFT_68553 [Tulasnella calospora MUT 4182]|uniref:Putative lipoate-protein ligase A n=1 Tax=Tulasnella calospora MUT 4182 TaxID=1051891 RepID=A0A0C3MBC0_9AGAM|nr:hypothetical protein M407DRAFT_68553 [Tulasnella calospora MUT 4182]